jgi:hypothetical protein
VRIASHEGIRREGTCRQNVALRTLGNRLVGILHGCPRHHAHYSEHTTWTPPRPQLDCIAEDYAALTTTIPDDFWHEMRDQHLVAANAPLPIDR